MSFYGYLNSIWRRERQSQDLIDLESDFFNRARQHLKHLERVGKSDQYDDLHKELFQKRLDQTRYLVNDLIDLRIIKHIGETLKNGDQDLRKRKFTDEEIDFRERLSRYTSTFRAFISKNSNEDVQIPTKMNYDNSLTLQIKREKLSSDLIDLDKEFLNKVKHYLTKLDNEKSNKNYTDLSQEIFSQRSKMSYSQIWELIDLRINKHVREILSGEFVETTNRKWPSQEIEYRSKLEQLINDFKEAIYGYHTFEEETESRFQLIEMIKAENTPKIGPNLEFYGPYKPNDIVYLPVEIAKFILNESKAENINY